LLTGYATDLLAALRETFPRWDCSLDDGCVVVSYRTCPVAYRPPRRSPSWADLLTTMSDACTSHGIGHAEPLPLCGIGDAELTFSAVQALDPYIKRCQPHVYRQGFLPQPAVRFTGQRDQQGTLLPGFATSFVNTSVVQPIDSVAEHAGLIDAWIGVLSRIGFHARHLTITGRLASWQRPPVAGITLRFSHEDIPLGDAVLLWNRDDPSRLATDIGSGLERLAWALTRRSWPETVYGPLAAQADTATLDAVRTATLIVGTGILPGPRGPGSLIRRLLRQVPDGTGPLGLSRVVRWAHEYWSQTAPLPVPWPQICQILDTESHGIVT
jgi:hypothetical protein